MYDTCTLYISMNGNATYTLVLTHLVSDNTRFCMGCAYMVRFSAAAIDTLSDALIRRQLDRLVLET